MQSGAWLKVSPAVVSLGATAYTGMAGLDSVFPTALVCLLISVPVATGHIASVRAGSAVWRNPYHGAASAAILTFSGLMATLSLLISLFLQQVANRFGLNGLFEGDFVRVTINDAQEFCYSVCLLLLIWGGYRVALRMRSRARGGRCEP